MLYRNFKGKRISMLGFGAMRLPVLDGDIARIDEKQTAAMVDYAMRHGVNYYDTAYGYHEGNSEKVMGRLLRGYPRNSFYLASKFPGYDVSNMGKVHRIFEEQLRKCSVDYFDFYLFHNVCEANIEGYLDPRFGIHDYLLRQKQEGRIKHLGFSVHGNNDTLRRFLDAYGDSMEFAQIQLNYLDLDFQNAFGKLEQLAARGIPVLVMEPLRGGKLAELSPEHLDLLRALRPEESAVGWAFRFLQGMKQILTVLSGMSSLEQLKQNIAIFSEYKPLSVVENQTLLDIAKDMTARTVVPCTACRYCTSYCPQGLDIPMLLELYNEFSFTGGGFIAPMRLASMDESERPSACIGCRSCESVCPQQINISEIFEDFAAKC